ncbi:MAG: hypothetical protein ACOCV4_00190 [Myxococcota bacterium]
MIPRWVHWARPWVVRTRNVPPLRSIYGGLYGLTVHRLRNAMREPPAGLTVLLRGSARGRVDAGLSDVDLVAVLPDVPASEEPRLVEWVVERVRRVNRPIPLVRDVHLFQGRELVWLAQAGHNLPLLVRHDATVMAGPALPSLPEALQRAALRRKLAYWVHRGVEQWLLGKDEVDLLLAARSFAKARALPPLIDGGTPVAGDHLVRAMRARRSDRPADAREAARALMSLGNRCGTADRLAPPPVRDGRAAPDAPPGWNVLRAAPGVLGAVQAPAGCAWRTHVVLNPGDLVDALGALRRHLRSTHQGGAPPRVVTPELLERTIVMPDAASEAYLRPALGVVHGRTGLDVRASAEELRHALAEDLLVESIKLRARFWLADLPRARRRAEAFLGGPAQLAEDLLAGRDVRPCTDRHPLPPSTGRSGAHHAWIQAWAPVRDAIIPRLLEAPPARPG